MARVYTKGIGENIGFNERNPREQVQARFEKKWAGLQASDSDVVSIMNGVKNSMGLGVNRPRRIIVRKADEGEGEKFEAGEYHRGSDTVFLFSGKGMDRSGETFIHEMGHRKAETGKGYAQARRTMDSVTPAQRSALKKISPYLFYSADGSEFFAVAYALLHSPGARDLPPDIRKILRQAIK